MILTEGLDREYREMSTPSNKLKTILWAAAVAVLMSGPVYALDDDLFDDVGTTKGDVSARSCGKEKFNDIVSVVLIEPDGPFQGAYVLTFGDDIIGQDAISGPYIEARPDKRMTMAMDDVDYIQLNDLIDDLLDLNCGGTLLDALVITRFDGTLSRNMDRLKIKFRSKFEWMDTDGKMRHGRFNFQSRFDNLQSAM
jgi:hypothetical protein